MGLWPGESIRLFRTALTTDINRAWEIFVDAAGGVRPTISVSQPWGGWTVGSGPATRDLDTLWKRYRRHQATCSAAGDRRASEVLDDITSLLNDAAQSRLERWKAAVRTRGGAARWIKSKMAGRGTPRHPELDSALFSPTGIARRLADGLAARWNVGISTFCRSSGPSTSFVGDARPQWSSLTPSPAPRPRSPIDLSLFSDAPPIDPLSAWTPEVILEHLPSGNPGLDGHTTEWIQHLSVQSLGFFADLLNAADRGVVPSFWSFARVTLIPKGPGSDADDCRAITILAVSYRLWAKRHARHLTHWLNSWKPAGLTGAVPNLGAADQLWTIQSILDDARCGRRPHAFLLIKY